MFSITFTFATMIALAQIVGINLVLSGDNALVIALACRDLPTFHRRMGIILGSLGAIVARLVLVFVAAFVLTLPGVKLVGGLFLFWIAYKLFHEGDEGIDHESSPGLWEAVRTIVVADVVMSIDNVVAIAAAAHDNYSLLIIGLLISIPMIVAGAELLSWLLAKYKWLVYVGGGLLCIVAFETVFSDPILSWVHFL